MYIRQFCFVNHKSNMLIINEEIENGISIYPLAELI